MKTFLYEVVARIVGAYLFFDSIRAIRQGVAARKIRYINTDVINWLLNPFLPEAARVADRDATPIRFWIEIGERGFLGFCCLVMAIIGWQPNP